MSAHSDIDMISFTGSTRAGVLVSQQAAHTIKRVSLELGGKGPNVVMDDADLEKAVKGCIRSCMENSGQSCLAPTRLIVPVEKIDEAIAYAQKACERVTVGDPTNPDVKMGSMASEAQYNTTRSYIQKGIEEGAQLVVGGLDRPEGLDKGFFVQPTVFANVSNDMTIAQEEIFGPVLCIIGYENEEEAVRIANETPYGLTGYVQSADEDRARQFARRIRTGAVHINGAGVDFRAPFGGYKQSGNGREWGVYGIEEFLETKSIVG